MNLVTFLVDNRSSSQWDSLGLALDGVIVAIVNRQESLDWHVNISKLGRDVQKTRRIGLTLADAEKAAFYVQRGATRTYNVLKQHPFTAAQYRLVIMDHFIRFSNEPTSEIGYRPFLNFSEHWAVKEKIAEDASRAASILVNMLHQRRREMMPPQMAPSPQSITDGQRLLSLQGGDNRPLITTGVRGASPQETLARLHTMGIGRQ